MKINTYCYMPSWNYFHISVNVVLDNSLKPYFIPTLAALLPFDFHSPFIRGRPPLHIDDTTNSWNMKKRSETRQTQRTGCSKGSQKFRPAADPLPGGAGRPKFNQLEMVTTFTYKPILVKINARNFELSW